MKTKGLLNLSHTAPTQGLAFIGDPHVWSRKPGRRRDADHLGAIIGKMEWCADACNEKNLWPVILGDLLHDPTDNGLIMLERLEHALARFHRKPIVLTGNHDLQEVSLTEGSTLHFLHSTGKIHCIIDNGLFASITVEDGDKIRKVALGGTPYGQTVPDHIGKTCGWSGFGKLDHDAVKKKLGVDDVVWITHDDMAFDKPYPGSKALHPVIGADLAVNGHMHGWQQPIAKGPTAWHNPGNINRMTVDLKDHVPRLWLWWPARVEYQDGGDGLPVQTLHPLVIPHAKGPDAFSLEGRISQTALSQDDGSSAQGSRFVALSAQNMTGADRTDDGVYLMESIQAEADRGGDSDEVVQIVSNLLDRTVNLKAS